MARYGFTVPFLPEHPPRPKATDDALTLDRPPELPSAPSTAAQAICAFEITEGEALMPFKLSSSDMRPQ
jgi:hypothetical protein